MISALLPLGLAFLMFVVGMRLTFAGMAAVFRRPAALIAGLAVQIVILPLVALALSRVFALSGAMTAGLLIIAVSPGGITSNYIALLARADIALSASMTLVTSLAAALTIPAVLGLAGQVPEIPGAGGNGALLKLSMAMTLVSAVPLIAGIGFRRYLARLAARLDVTADRASRIVFFAIVLATFIENWGAMTANLAEVGMACLLLNLAGLLAGYGAGRLGGFGPDRTVAIALEAGLQNAAVAMFVAASIYASPALAIPGLIYAVFMNVTALAVIALRRSGAARMA